MFVKKPKLEYDIHSQQDTIQKQVMQLKPKFDQLQQLQEVFKSHASPLLQMTIIKLRKQLEQSIQNLILRGIDVFDILGEFGGKLYESQILTANDTIDNKEKQTGQEAELYDFVNEDSQLDKHVKNKNMKQTAQQLMEKKAEERLIEMKMRGEQVHGGTKAQIISELRAPKNQSKTQMINSLLSQYDAIPEGEPIDDQLYSKLSKLPLSTVFKNKIQREYLSGVDVVRDRNRERRQRQRDEEQSRRQEEQKRAFEEQERRTQELVQREREQRQKRKNEERLENLRGEKEKFLIQQRNQEIKNDLEQQIEKLRLKAEFSTDKTPYLNKMEQKKQDLEKFLIQSGLKQEEPVVEENKIELPKHSYLDKIHVLPDLQQVSDSVKTKEQKEFAESILKRMYADGIINSYGLTKTYSKLQKQRKNLSKSLQNEKLTDQQKQVIQVIKDAIGEKISKIPIDPNSKEGKKVLEQQKQLTLDIMVAKPKKENIRSMNKKNFEQWEEEKKQGLPATMERMQKKGMIKASNPAKK